MLARLDVPNIFWRRTDQTFLETFFPDWHKLPYTFNTMQYVYFNLPELWVWKSIRIVHYQYEKPWAAENPKRALLQPLIDLWWSVFEGKAPPADLPVVKPAAADGPACVTAAVTGATGYVGRFIVSRLIEEGVPVRAWRRKSSDVSGLPAAVEWVDGALDRHETHAALIDGADMLVHSALDHIPGKFRRGEGPDLGRYLRTNIAETLALLAAARDAGVGRCVVLSSRAVFGAWPNDRMLADDAPVRPDTIYGASKAAVEAFVMNWGLADGWPIAALRPTGVYGVTSPPEKSKWFDLVGKALRSEAVEARIGTEVHGRDVAQAVWRLLTAEPDDRRRAHVQLQRPRRLDARHRASGASHRRHRRACARGVAATKQHYGLRRAQGARRHLRRLAAIRGNRRGARRGGESPRRLNRD